MIGAVGRGWRGRLAAVLQLDDDPERIARGLALGVFIGCTPFWGLQTVLAVVLATLLRLNRLAAVTGAWLNLPWIAPLVYGLALQVGTLLVPDRDGARSAWLTALRTRPTSLTWADALAALEQVSLALLVGTTVVGAVAALATYLVARAVIAARRGRGGGAAGPRGA